MLFALVEDAPVVLLCLRDGLIHDVTAAVAGDQGYEGSPTEKRRPDRAGSRHADERRRRWAEAPSVAEAI